MNCLLHSFKTVTGLDIVARLGHDGSAIQYPDLDEPLCRRGLHTQEMFKAVWPDFMCMELQAWPVMRTEDRTMQLDHSKWFAEMIRESTGILIGESYSGIPHAVPCVDGEYPDELGAIASFILILPMRNDLIPESKISA